MIRPSTTRAFLRPREKPLILLVLVTFACVCFGAIFFLPPSVNPANSSQSQGNKAFRVYQELQKAGESIFLPPPPLQRTDDGVEAAGNGPAVPVRHGVLDRPDPHAIEDRARLMAQIELESQVEEARKKVLPKPNLEPPVKDKNPALSNPAAGKISSTRKGSVLGLPDTNRNPSGKLPVVQDGADPDPSVQKKRDKVKQMMLHAWNGYSKYAWGANEVKPVSKRAHSGSVFGSSSMGATIIDAMDTLYIMGLMKEFQAGKEWVEQELDFNHMSGEISVFETNIRYVGGLLTLYALTGDDLYKDKAVHVAQKLLPAFNTPTGIPMALVNMRTGSSKNFGWAAGGSSILAEFGTMHMEFAYLSDITGDPVYREKVEKVRDVLYRTEKPKGLYPIYMNPKTGKWGQQHSSMGALGDSFYEYLLKEWLRSGKRDRQAREMYVDAAKAVETHMVKKSREGLTYFAEYKYGRVEHKMDHLACFGGGMYALGAKNLGESQYDHWLNLGAEITKTCHESYDRSDTKLGPEAFRFTDSSEARGTKSNERYYILRPETFESYFVMWRLTHDQKYRDWGWQAVQALEANCKAEAGYSGIKNVYSVGSQKDDVQQSFLLSETLKYLYLLFSDDDLISLDDWVFNTECHPLPVKGKNPFYREAKAKTNQNLEEEEGSNMAQEDDE